MEFFFGIEGLNMKVFGTEREVQMAENAAKDYCIPKTCVVKSNRYGQ